MRLLNYLKERSDRGDVTVASLLADYNSDPRNWREVTAKEMNDWLGEKGREFALKKYAASLDDSVDTAQVVSLKSSINTLLRSLNLPETSIKVAPGAKHRGLINAISAAIPMEAATLVALGWLGETSTEADVTTTLTIITRTEAANAANAANQLAYDLARQINEASIDDAELSPVTLDSPAVPEGYSWSNGTLSKDGA